DTSEGSCPYLTKDNKGNIVLSWIKKTDSVSFIYCYAISKDKGKTFGNAVEIPGSNNIFPHGENMPKIVFKPSGEIIAVWGAANPNPANSYAGMVFYSQSLDAGKSWTKATRLVTDTAGFDQRYFDVALLPDGEAAIDWLDNRDKSIPDGSSLFFAYTNGNSGFTDERMVAGPCCPCCRTDLFVDSKNDIHVLYRGIINDSIRDMVHTVSTDDGKTFSTPERISKDNWVINGCPHTGPAMTENKNGLQFTWFTAGGGAGVYCCNSNDNGQTFSTRSKVSGKSARHSQIISTEDGKSIIAWDENFISNNIVSSRIGIDVRSDAGDSLIKEFITPENLSVSFPVLKPLDGDAVLVAYTESINDRDYIRYKIITL
ncbi:MAG TPA: sialidase family protein, partial [Ginsengibacter sp.]